MITTKAARTPQTAHQNASATPVRFRKDRAPNHRQLNNRRLNDRLGQIKPLIVCRGPVRMEAIRVFESLGTLPCGMLLSEKDSVVYRRTLAPELRLLGRNPQRVHRVRDYIGRDGAETAALVTQIIALARQHNYTHLFAGYGFMAEDAGFIGAIEEAGLGFIGPSARIASHLGAKDAAKTLARQLGVSVTPGEDHIEAQALLRQAGNQNPQAFLESLARQHDLPLPSLESDAQQPLAARALRWANALLQAARQRQRELVSISQLQQEATTVVARLLTENPGRRFRLKHIGGGGGKGQRIVTLAADTAEAVSQVLQEARATGAADNKNFLIELNIEGVQHYEIQLIGNGKWCLALGGRDCSLQIHEQKLLELSLSTEQFAAEAARARSSQAEDATTRATFFERQQVLLARMENEAVRLGQAVGLDSVSTFECIVEGDRHYFMEVNTRIQVEHRVTEGIYELELPHPEQPGRRLRIESLVEAMVWLAAYGPLLSKPRRLLRAGSAAEIRLNATNAALVPHAGGVILDWNPPLADELRDDQGIGLRYPQSQHFIPYQLAGAYDSNVALIVHAAADRQANLEGLRRLLAATRLRGADLCLNHSFHRGLLQWLIGQDVFAQPNTQFVQHYLTAVGLLHAEAEQLDLDQAWKLWCTASLTDKTSSNAAGSNATGSNATGSGIDADPLSCLAAKHNLILRPLKLLLADPHQLAGWIAKRQHGLPWTFSSSAGWRWKKNPLAILAALYRYVQLLPPTTDAHAQDPAPLSRSAEHRIWPEDEALLATGLAFYADLERHPALHTLSWEALTTRLDQPQPPEGWDTERWQNVQAAHRGHQLGLMLLALPALCAYRSGFYDLNLAGSSLQPRIPISWSEAETVRRARYSLNPPAPATPELRAWTGGTFYTRSHPEAPPYVEVGETVAAGRVVGLLEVMKMFNPLQTSFAGQVTKIHAQHGSLVSRGQVLLEITPTETIAPPDLLAEARKRRSFTQHCMQMLTTPAA